MLKLEAMEIAGFKSFRERVQIRFPEGITGFVGPNGCGKSNLLDAMCWALGEQSALALRGQRMQDLIFNGTRHRKPAPLAEVKMRLSGTNGDGDETLELVRRLFQSGDSEYVLNGRKVRLKDITERLMGTGIGVRAYSTIHQGKIDEILSSRPEDRRLLIEEAAGVTRYRSRRRSATLKLERTEQDLLRVEDILREVGRQRNSLKRQASAARRFRTLKERERELLRLEFGLRARDLAARFEQAGQELGRAREHEAETARATAELEAALEQFRLRLQEQSEKLGALRDAQHRRERDIDLLEQQIQTCARRREELDTDLAARRLETGNLEMSLHQDGEEILELERTFAAEEDRLGQARTQVEEADAEFNEKRRLLQSLEQETERAREAVFAATAAISDHRNAAEGAGEAAERARAVSSRFRSEAADCLAEQEKAGETLASAELALAAARETLEKAAVARDAVREEVAGIESQLAEAREVREQAIREESRQDSRLVLLKQLDEQGSRCAEGVRALLEAAREAQVPGFRGLVADHLDVDPGMETAVEAALRERLQWVVVAGSESAARAADQVLALETGGVSFLYGTPPGSGGPPETPEGCLPLSDAIACEDDAVRGALASWLERAFVVEDAGRAAELASTWPERIFVTRDGCCWGPGPVLHQLGADSEGRMLELKRQVRETQEALGAATHRRAGAEARCARLERDLSDLSSRVRENEAEVQRTERALFEAEHRAAAAAQAQDRLGNQHGMLVAEAERAEEEALGRDRAREEAQGRVVEAEEERSRRAAGLEEVREQASAAGNHLGALERELRRLREILADRRESRESVRLRLAHARQRRSENQEALERLRGEIAQMDGRREALLREAEGAETSLERVLRDREEAQGDVREAEEAVTGTRLQMQAAEEGVKASHEAREKAARATSEVEIRMAGLRSDREHLQREVQTDLGESIDQVLAGPPLPPAEGEETTPGWDDPGLPALEEIASELGEVRSKLDRIGSVNLSAVDEFEELDQRFTFLATQDEDIRNSIESLRKTIREIDRISRERFTETFVQVRENFIETFNILFKGGECDMRLQDSEDPLNSGVEIYAQPPGKRLQNIRLLSGGEKALSAIAFLFALFRFKPSPFCVLDEVDAPLDDMNLTRFLELIEKLQEDTQFILITHNKLSMERADMLYGVTMQEPGCSKLVSVDFRGNGKSNGNGRKASGNGNGNGNGNGSTPPSETPAVPEGNGGSLDASPEGGDEGN